MAPTLLQLNITFVHHSLHHIAASSEVLEIHAWLVLAASVWWWILILENDDQTTDVRKSNNC